MTLFSIIKSTASLKSILFEIILASAFLNLTLLAFPIFIQLLFDRVLPFRSHSTLSLLAIGMLVFILAEATMKFARGCLLNFISKQIETTIYHQLIDHFLKLPLNFFENKLAGELSKDILEAESIKIFFTKQLPDYIISAISLILILPLLCLYNFFIAKMILFYSILAAALTYTHNKPITQLLKSVYLSDSQRRGHLTEMIQQIKTIKYLQIENNRLDKWSNLHSNYQHIQLTASQAILKSETIITLIEKLLMLTVIWLGCKSVLAEQMTIGSLIAFQLLCSTNISSALIKIAQLMHDINRTRISINKLNDIFTVPIVNRANQLNTVHSESIIQFNKVSLFYANKQILDNIYLSIPLNQFTLIMGESGSGKTSLINLISGAIEPNAGRITFQMPDKIVNIDQIQQYISIIPQEIPLFKGTIRENISLSKSTATDHEIQAAANLANIDSFIQTLPDGYNTEISGIIDNVSTGQKQRLAIARAMLSDKPILILDEATSALDSITEQTIWRNLLKIKERKTIIAITHRTAIAPYADNIILINNGRIEITGTHKTLIQHSGLYQQLYYYQPCAI